MTTPWSVVLGVLLAVLGLLAGCAELRISMALRQTPWPVLVWPGEPRVRFEPGAEWLAERAAAQLPKAIERVVEVHGRPFAAPVEVYACATDDCFARLSGIGRPAGAVVFNGRVLLSPLLERPGLAGPYLTHELSHLHLIQRLGASRYHALLPAWFQEGLAVLVSGGGELGVYSDADAARAILAGRHFTAEPADGRLPKHAGSYRLDPHLFYRQAGLFVRFLRRLGEREFVMMLDEVQAGSALQDALARAYGITLDAAWQRFVDELQAARARGGQRGPLPSGGAEGVRPR